MPTGNPSPRSLKLAALAVGAASAGILALGWFANLQHRSSATTETRAAIIAREHASVPWHPAQRRSHHEAMPRRLADARAESDPAQGSAVMAQLADSIADSQLGATLRSLASSDLTTEFASLLMRRWAAKDSAAASVWVNRLPDGPEKTEMTSQLLVIWSETDGAAAKEWVQQLPAGDSRDAATLTLAYQSAPAGPDAALNLALALPSGHARDQFLSHAISEWTAADALAAAHWVEQVADESLRGRLISALATAAAENDAANAADLVAESLPPGEEQGRAAVGVVQRWVQQDAPGAATWVARFPEGPARDAAVENLVKLWADRDARETAAWLNGLTDDTLRDQAISTYAGAISARSPATALQWAQTIKNPVTREKQLSALARH